MKYHLLFDSGCSTCTKLARAIEDESGGRLAIRSLHDPQVQALLKKARPGWQWQPSLLELEGERPRVFTGLAMAARLVRDLGPRRAWRVGRLMWDADVSLHNSSPAILGRRSFIKSGALMLGLLLPGFELPGRTQLRSHDNQYLKSELVTGEEATSYIHRSLASVDVTALDLAAPLNISGAVVSRHFLTYGRLKYTVYFPVSNRGYVVHHMYEQPADGTLLHSTAAYYEYLEGDPAKGAYFISGSENGEPLRILQSWDDCPCGVAAESRCEPCPYDPSSIYATERVCCQDPCPDFCGAPYFEGPCGMC